MKQATSYHEIMHPVNTHGLPHKLNINMLMGHKQLIYVMSQHVYNLIGLHCGQLAARRKAMYGNVPGLYIPCIQIRPGWIHTAIQLAGYHQGKHIGSFSSCRLRFCCAINLCQREHCLQQGRLTLLNTVEGPTALVQFKCCAYSIYIQTTSLEPDMHMHSAGQYSQHTSAGLLNHHRVMK